MTTALALEILGGIVATLTIAKVLVDLGKIIQTQKTQGERQIAFEKKTDEKFAKIDEKLNAVIVEQAEKRGAATHGEAVRLPRMSRR